MTVFLLHTTVVIYPDISSGLAGDGGYNGLVGDRVFIASTLHSKSAIPYHVI